MVAGVAAIAGVLAVLSGASPTGEAVPDAVVCFAVAAFVTWIGATAPWWALGMAAGVAAIVAVGGPVLLVVVAAVATVAAFEIGFRRSGVAVARAAIAGAVVQVLVRFEVDPFFLSSALIAAAIGGLIVVTGLMRRRGYVRTRVYWSFAGVLLAALVATVGVGVGGLRARTPATDGYRAMLLGLERMQGGDLAGAQLALTEATDGLRSGGNDLGGPFTQAGRFVPFVAQNRSGGADLLLRAADASQAAAGALSVVDLEQLRIVNGVVDIGALEILAAPLADLEQTVVDLTQVLDDADSPWLVGAFQKRLTTARERAGDVVQIARGASAAARIGPGLLGADEPRRYLIMFVNNAEQRGTGGLMGNWSELTMDGGRLEVTASGRAAQLSNQFLANGDFFFDAGDDFFNRYGIYGGGARDIPVNPKFLSNITMPPDMPTVGSLSAQYYTHATGRDVDGVFVIDPTGIASLLEVTGPIDVAGIDMRLDSNNAERFLTIDQYEFVEDERRDLLAAVTEGAVEALLTSELPGPQVIARAMGPAVVNGHISMWAADDGDQELFELIGADNTMPRFDGDNAGSDGLAVVTTNASGNKIDSFLQREVRYSVAYDPASGALNAFVDVTLTNEAPTSGYPDYVIGNIVDLPVGTNQMLVTLYTRHSLSRASVDATAIEPIGLYELGLNIFTAQIAVPAGESRTVRYELSGQLAAGDYRLLYRPQALPRPDRVVIDVRDPDGDVLLSREGPIERRSVLTDDSIEAWRPAGD